MQQAALRLASRTGIFYGWFIVAAAGAASFARNPVAVATLSVFTKPMHDEFGWSRTLFSGAASVGGLLGAAVSPAAGTIVDRHGSRAVLTLSAIIVGAGAIGLSLVAGPVGFYAAYGAGRMLFAGPIQIATTTAVANWFVRRRARATAIVTTCHSAGITVFPLAAQLFINGWGWRTAWFALGLIVWGTAVLPCAVLLIRRPEDVGLRPDGRPGGPEPPRSQRSRLSRHTAGELEEQEWTLREAVRAPALWLLALAGGMLFMVQAGVSLHQAPYFQEKGLSPTLAAAAVSTFAFANTPGSLLFGFLAERVNIRYCLALPAFALAGMTGLLISVGSAPQAFLSAAVFGLALGGLATLLPVAFADYFGRRSLGVIRGITAPFSAVGQAGGVLLGGVVYDTTGSYFIAFAAFGALALAGTVLVLLARPPVKSNAS
ncbi:MAG: MFS transporter [Chloroflexi bacterium]|nr:MFS transporter [Chloroflexota bacterium]